MPFYEINIALEGLYYKYRTSWEQTRMLAFISALPHSKKGLKPTDIVKYPWDDESTEIEEITEEDISRLHKKQEEIIKGK